MKGFKVRKAAQVAAFLTKAEGGSINVLKLVKLIYLSDREFLRRYDRPILNDRLASMDHGPVNSKTLDYINGSEDAEEWDAFISARERHTVELSNPNMSVDVLDELSDAEIGVLGEVHAQFKGWDRFQVRDYTHEHCPEWEDPKGSSAPIPYERVLKFLKKANPIELAREIEDGRRLDALLAAE